MLHNLKQRFFRQSSNDPQLETIANQNRALLERVDKMQVRFRSLARSIWRVEEDERRRIARELHDNLGQILTALRLRIEKLPEGEDRDAASELAAQALADIRNLSRLLRPSVLDDLGLEAALQWLARNVRDNSGLPVRFSGSLDTRLDDETETMLFRIAQEALTNVVKHANATRADLSIQRTGNIIEMRVRDNGAGFDAKAKLDPNAEVTVGLTGMRDRVTFFGGDFIVSSAPDKGTTVTVTLPRPDTSTEEPA